MVLTTWLLPEEQWRLDCTLCDGVGFSIPQLGKCISPRAKDSLKENQMLSSLAMDLGTSSPSTSSQSCTQAADAACLYSLKAPTQANSLQSQQTSTKAFTRLRGVSH